MLSALITKAFWLKVWNWCKINWKFLLGISIPIIISILLRKGTAAKIYKKASETRKMQLDTLEKSHVLEASRKGEAQKEFLDAMDRVNHNHADTMRRIAEQEKKQLNEIDTAEKATKAIKEKLEE